jgi:hypothetical protein
MADIVTDLSIRKNWKVARGFNNIFTFTFTQSGGGGAFVTTSYTFSLQIRRFGSSTNTVILTQGSGITNGGASGIVTVVLNAVNSALLTDGEYFWQLTVVHPDTFTYRWYNGTLTATNEIYSGDTASGVTTALSINGTNVTGTINIAGGDTLAQLGTTLQTAVSDTPLDADTSYFWDAVDAVLKKWNWAAKKDLLKTYFDTLYVALTGDQTIAGVKTFSSSPIVPTPTTATQAANKTYVDGVVVGLWDDRGNFDASVNAYPSSGGSGTAGAIMKGDIWTISVAGTLPTAQVVEIGDTVRALVDTPGNTQGNWSIQQNNIGYTPQSQATVVSSNTTAANDGVYHVTASATFTDPTPVEGKGFTVFVRNGTATVGGTAYSLSGTIIRRTYYSGAWANNVNRAIYTIPTGSGLNASSPADGAIFYGGMPLNIESTTAILKAITVYEPSIIIAAYYIWVASGVAGSAQDISFYIRVNNTADHLIATIGNTSSFKKFENQSLSISLAANDYFEIKVVCPTWTTNPSNVTCNGYVTLVNV